MTRTTRERPALPVLLAIALPVLLAVVVAGIGIAGRLGVVAPAEQPVETGPLAVVPVDAPDATGPECAALLAALPAELDAADAPLPGRPLAEPAQPGVRAWAALPRPVVLRCGLPRPVELTPTSALLEVNGVQWLQLDDGVPDPVVISYVAVDRPVYAIVTIPPALGSGPLQQLSDVVRAALPATTVRVR
ncbi:DUF3515 domain-containing protein [Pseudonocardia lacus]|uniref:DUF3515 domain-containing protein n=1 Tax=Pseudonocardia lacus TaxID=2835865 RepID=UPI0020298259|nr:DUF3515 domain-containing protein [Pseudonocardia lacus]